MELLQITHGKMIMFGKLIVIILATLTPSISWTVHTMMVTVIR